MIRGWALIKSRERHEIKITLAPTQATRQQSPKMTFCWWLRKSAVKIRTGGGIQEGQAWERRCFHRWGTKVFKTEHARGNMKTQNLLEKQKF